MHNLEFGYWTILHSSLPSISFIDITFFEYSSFRMNKLFLSLVFQLSGINPLHGAFYTFRFYIVIVAPMFEYFFTKNWGDGSPKHWEQFCGDM